MTRTGACSGGNTHARPQLLLLMFCCRGVGPPSDLLVLAEDDWQPPLLGLVCCWTVDSTDDFVWARPDASTRDTWSAVVPYQQALMQGARNTPNTPPPAGAFPLWTRGRWLSSHGKPTRVCCCRVFVTSCDVGWQPCHCSKTNHHVVVQHTNCTTGLRELGVDPTRCWCQPL